MRRTVVWRGLDGEPRMEIARVDLAGGEVRASGTQIGVTYELRYRGQAFELAVPGSPRADPAELAERFAAEHELRYGYRDPDAEVELVNLRLALVVPGPAPQPEAAPAGRLQRSARPARFGGAWMEADSSAKGSDGSPKDGAAPGGVGSAKAGSSTLSGSAGSSM